MCRPRKKTYICKHIEPGCTIGYHCHDTSSEVIYILSGDARVLYDDGEEHLAPGQCHYCPKGHSHSLVNASATETLTYFAVVPEQYCICITGH